MKIPTASFEEFEKEFFKDRRFREFYLRRSLVHDVGCMLTEARITMRMTQKELANAIGTTQSSIARAEEGRLPVGLLFLEKIAKAYGTYVEAPKFAFMDKIHAVEERERRRAEWLKTEGLDTKQASRAAPTRLRSKARTSKRKKGVEKRVKSLA